MKTNGMHITEIGSTWAVRYDSRDTVHCTLHRVYANRDVDTAVAAFGSGEDEQSALAAAVADLRREAAAGRI